MSVMLDEVVTSLGLDFRLTWKRNNCRPPSSG